jgi:hypothetical protein
MNERIRELAADAGYPDYMTYGQDMVLERFAELIVRRCALTAGLMEHDGRKNIGAQILDNFGIQDDTV